MEPIDLLFELIYKFVPINADEYAKLKGEAKGWAKDQHEGSEGMVGKLYAKHGRKWQTRLACAVLYIPLVKMIQDWINPKAEEQEQD